MDFQHICIILIFWIFVGLLKKNVTISYQFHSCKKYVTCVNSKYCNFRLIRWHSASFIQKQHTLVRDKMHTSNRAHINREKRHQYFQRKWKKENTAFWLTVSNGSLSNFIGLSLNRWLNWSCVRKLEKHFVPVKHVGSSIFFSNFLTNKALLFNKALGLDFHRRARNYSSKYFSYISQNRRCSNDEGDRSIPLIIVRKWVEWLSRNRHSWEWKHLYLYKR